MDDISAPPYDSKAVEFWIFQELKKNKQPAYIADELLKHWEKSHFLLPAKASAGHFCLRHGFHTSLLRQLRNDLSAGTHIPWAVMIEAFSGPDEEPAKEILDAFLSGATRDKQLHLAAAAAMTCGSTDPRWPKILSSELHDRFTEATKTRNKIFKELQIFRTEGMLDELKESIAKILTLFPGDPEVLEIASRLGERDIERTLDRLRKFKERKLPKEPKEAWPELTAKLKPLKATLDLESAYYLSIALHQMTLFEDALDILRSQKNKWTTREKLWELELLVSQGFFAETLGITQLLMHQSVEEADVLRAVLYYTAKAYRGLEDNEQAISILKGILKYEPNYRDASVLLVEWEVE